jgi:uncharacterized RDD family membrane protein YckC
MDNTVEYGGFWIRTGAAIIDSIIVLLVITPLLTAIYGTDYWLSGGLVQGPLDVIINYVFPAVAIIVFWIYKSATPGKMVTHLTIVDAKTGGHPTTAQFVIRYLGYYLAAIPLFLGIIWVGFDRRKQGWHDKIAGTVVIRRKEGEPVVFEESP